MSSMSRQSDKAPGLWQPPGRRWGCGARSVVPYLNHSVQAKLLAIDIAEQDKGPVRNPVFHEMQITLRV
ncbi:hypothetical protein FN976_00820 [Caenimonas sedimenti]|uniref:Uncharacterized protein n=1 Tax=Caenimonas sedimenti TaxID=2596921 RepID=A0A562ZXS4_9BURK|nr:hypothetical protein [Caenimonas sedimenti]TWO73420.1 hypothetical protein FN976_00820 [Caenimonas sedimenti]